VARSRNVPAGTVCHEADWWVGWADEAMVGAGARVRRASAGGAVGPSGPSREIRNRSDGRRNGRHGRPDRAPATAGHKRDVLKAAAATDGHWPVRSKTHCPDDAFPHPAPPPPHPILAVHQAIQRRRHRDSGLAGPNSPRTQREVHPVVDAPLSANCRGSDDDEGRERTRYIDGILAGLQKDWCGRQSRS